jgi:hypothetical protein
VLAIVTVGVAAGSIWLVFMAVRTLGAQWAYVARVTEGHRLITDGPYRWVRNPIYTGMLGMMLATGLAVSSWIAFPIAIVVFGVGTYIRVSREEKILHSEFGEQWDEYKRRGHLCDTGPFGRKKHQQFTHRTSRIQQSDDVLGTHAAFFGGADQLLNRSIKAVRFRFLTSVVCQSSSAPVSPLVFQ